MNAHAFRRFPELFARPGGGGRFTYGIWFSYLALWFLCDPMFPQLFQRFMAARTARSLRVTALLYPLVTGVLFFLPVAGKLSNRSKEETLQKELILEGILSIQSGDNPRFVREKLLTFLPPAARAEIALQKQAT